jgi:hypothetical protein
MTAEIADDVRLRLPRGAWTFDDLLDTPHDGRRWEIIDGSLHVSPAPTVRHQLVANKLLAMLNDGYREVAVARAGEEAPVTTPFQVTIRPSDLVRPK